jgi:K+-sensing histidine kinase KdpD
VKSSAGLYSAALTLAAAIFISDLLMPVSLGVWFLYVIPLALTALGHDSDVPLYAAAGTTLLIAITLIMDARTASGTALAVAEFNRGCGVVVIWTLALLVRSVVSTRLRMEADRWLRAQESQLLSHFQGDLTLADIAQRTLDLLADAVRAPVASLYVSEGSTLTLAATRGLRAGSDVPVSFAVGEGLIGQAAQSRRTTTLEDLTAELLPIRSSLIHGSSAAVTIWPVVADGTLHAVVEFGGLRRPPARALELLETVQHEVAVALRAARYRGQLRELLEETQRQSDDAELMLGVVGHDLRTPLGAIKTGRGTAPQ